MAIDLKKGGRINLAKEPSLVKLGVGLGWDVSDYKNASDLDASAFMLTESGKVPSDDFFVFYNNLHSPDGALVHKGDNRTGIGDGDDETLEVNLSKIDHRVAEISFIVTIHDAEIRRQTFGQVKNAYIRIYNLETNAQIAQYDLNEDFSNETAVELGRLYLKNREWRFMAVGEGYNNSLQGFVDKYV